MYICNVFWHWIWKKKWFYFIFPSYLPPFLHWGHSHSTNTSYYVCCVSIKIHVSINLDLTCAKSQGCQKVASCERYFDILAGPCIDRDALIKKQRRVCGPKANNILAAFWRRRCCLCGRFQATASPSELISVLSVVPGRSPVHLPRASAPTTLPRPTWPARRPPVPEVRTASDRISPHWKIPLRKFSCFCFVAQTAQDSHR